MPDMPRLLILNASADTCEMLEEFFRSREWNAVSVAVRDLRDGRITPAELIRTHAPDAMLVDVAIPYEANWALVQRLRDDPDVPCPIVLTTTNEAAVRRLVGARERVHEIIGKPYDLELLHDAVVRAVGNEAPVVAPPEADRRAGERRASDRRGASAPDSDESLGEDDQ
jgi:CheY-like chemotaxis protein